LGVPAYGFCGQGKAEAGRPKERFTTKHTKHTKKITKRQNDSTL
jgi:hypothetical protein